MLYFHVYLKRELFSLFRSTEKLIIIQWISEMIDWKLVLDGLDYCLESIQSQMFSPDRIILPVWPQTRILCRGVTLSYLRSALCCCFHSSSCSTAQFSLSIHRLRQAALSVNQKCLPSERLSWSTRSSRQPAHTHRYTNTWKDAAAEGEHRHGNADVEDHICALPNTLQSAEHARSGPPPPICSLGWAPHFILIHVIKEKKRPKTRFKSKICKLIILLSWWLL